MKHVLCYDGFVREYKYVQRPQIDPNEAIVYYGQLDDTANWVFSGVNEADNTVKKYIDVLMIMPDLYKAKSDNDNPDQEFYAGLYDELITICEIGKDTWATLDPVKYEQYTIYESNNDQKIKRKQREKQAVKTKKAS